MPVIRRFEEQARRAPAAPALVFGERTLSFGELDRRAAALARRLRAAGVGRESRVGLLVERSAELVVGLLGIWKAGGAYVPLDPGQPAARLAWLVEDALLGQAPAVLVTQEALAERLAALPLAAPQDLRTVTLDDGAGSPENAPLSVDVEPGDLAYVIHTSGTTGRPKGVLVEHGQLAATLAAAAAAFAPDAGDRMPCVASFTFDIFLFELLLPLLAGGVSHLIPLRPALDVPELVAALGRATLFHAVPALMREVVAEARGRGAAGGLRQLFVGGEAVPGELLAEMRAAFPQGRLAVLYGPTEATLICARHAVTGGEGERTLIGRPLPGAALELRDADGNPVPLGVAGEIWIGGGGVARGYLRRPELTAERFRPGEGGRWYRAGDLARRLADGGLEFLGRADAQIKIRGFRVEPGEVEAALLQHPDVREAAVGAAGDGRLAAWVALAPALEPGTAPSDLRGVLRPFLAARLPEYMVPSFFVAVDRLPRTPHGKLDRRALPPVDPAAEGAGWVAPATPTEERVAEIWGEILGLPRVSAAESFFDLGGHSLLATRIVSRLERSFGVPLSLRALFDAPTVAGVARVIEGLELAAAEERRLADLMADLEGLSEAEASALLAGAGADGGAAVV
jgi:amino acid adenylation domain-containing protein